MYFGICFVVHDLPCWALGSPRIQIMPSLCVSLFLLFMFVVVVVVAADTTTQGTLINMLREDFPGRFGFSVSHTTRGPRPGEVHGCHYLFSEKAAMQAEIDDNKFIEHANVHGNLYGTRCEQNSFLCDASRRGGRGWTLLCLDSGVKCVIMPAVFCFVKPRGFGTLVGTFLCFAGPGSLLIVEAGRFYRYTVNMMALGRAVAVVRSLPDLYM